MRMAVLATLLLTLVTGLCIQHKSIIYYKFALVMPLVSHCSSEPDEKIKALIVRIQQLGIPGGQISFVKQGQPQIDCAFGWGGTGGVLSPVSQTDIFRYASLTKIFTSMTAIKLAQHQTIGLDWRLLPLLELQPLPADTRVAEITLSQLLRHRAGFDRIISGDPMLNSQPWCPENLKILSQLKLDYAPGEKYSYSNLGYCLLGQALTKTTAKPLAELITDTLDIRQFSSIQPILSSDKLFNEVSYFFDMPDSEQQLFGFNYSAMLASGGWAGTADDITKLIHQQLNIDGSIRLFLDSGIDPDCDTSLWRKCHGMVFYKYQQPQNQTMYWRDGSLPGVSTLIAVTANGGIVTLLANYRPHKWFKFNDKIGTFIYEYFNEDKVPEVLHTN